MNWLNIPETHEYETRIARYERANYLFVRALRGGKAPRNLVWTVKGFPSTSALTIESHRTGLLDRKNALADTLRVRRDPCRFCGVRSDIGCRHA